MKFFAYIVCFYVTLLTVLPTVRAIKMHFSEKHETSCHNSNSQQNEAPSSCEKGKFIASLNFSPLEIINTLQLQKVVVSQQFESLKKENLFYKKVFIPKYKNTIWQPPKIFSLV